MGNSNLSNMRVQKLLTLTFLAVIFAFVTLPDFTVARRSGGSSRSGRSSWSSRSGRSGRSSWWSSTPSSNYYGNSWGYSYYNYSYGMSRPTYYHGVVVIAAGNGSYYQG